MAIITPTPAGNSDLITQEYQKVIATSAGNANQVGNEIKTLLHISGSQGLVYDAAGGELTNVKNAEAYYLNNEGYFRLAKSNEVRFQGAKFQYALGLGDSFGNNYKDWIGQSEVKTKIYSKKLTILNWATPGYSLADLTTVLNAHINDYAYSVIFLQGGINDIIGDLTLTQVQNILLGMIATSVAAHPNAMIVLFTTPPFNGSAWWSSNRQSVQTAYNSWLRTYASTNGYYLIDIYDILNDPANNTYLLSAYDSGDHLHPTVAGGYTAIADNVEATIGDYIPAAPVNPASAGILHEKATSNLFTYSTRVSPSPFILNTLLATYDAEMGPDQKRMATLIYRNSAGSAIVGINATVTTQATGGGTVKGFFKAKEYSRFALAGRAGASSLGYSKIFDLSVPAAQGHETGFFTSDPEAYVITPLLNGWFFCAIYINDINFTRGDFIPLNAGTDRVYAGTVNDGMYIYEFTTCPGRDFSYPVHADGAPVTVPIDSHRIPLLANVNFPQSKGIAFIKVTPQFANSATAKSLLCTSSAATEFIHDNGSGEIAINDGTNTATTSGLGGWAVGDTLLIAACWDSNAGLMSVHASKNGGSWIDSANTTYDGAFPAGANFLLCNANTDSILINLIKIKSTTKSLSNAQTWAKNNAIYEAV